MGTVPTPGTNWLPIRVIVPAEEVGEAEGPQLIVAESPPSGLVLEKVPTTAPAKAVPWTGLGASVTPIGL